MPVMVKVNLSGDAIVLSRLNKMDKTSTQLMDNITSRTGQYTLKIILETMPEFSGDAKENTQARKFPATKFGCKFQILFDKVIDRNYGHNYIWYMEHGRRAISNVFRFSEGGGRPLPGMRYWKTPPQSNANPNKIFAFNVRGAQPNNFVRNATNLGRGMATTFAMEAIRVWVR